MRSHDIGKVMDCVRDLILQSIESAQAVIMEIVTDLGFRLTLLERLGRS